MAKRPVSKAAQLRAADNLLRRLLGTPKTRPGLIAAVTASSQVSKNFVYGWLSENTRNGTVTVLKSGGRQTYQITVHAVVEVASEGVFPSWLEPRSLPVALGREVFISGQPTKTKKD